MTKKLQIIRVDNDLVQKANLQIGNNIIGRGAATGCNDEQHVKHAVTINLSPNDEMTITPVGPCYMKRAGCSRWQHLKLGTSVPIKPGDVCSLLPDKCWFKIISMPETMEGNDHVLKRKAEEDLNNEDDNKKASLSSSIEAVASSGEAPDIFDDNIDLLVKRENSPINGNSEYNDAPPVLQEIYSASSPDGNYLSERNSKTSSNSQEVNKLPIDKTNKKRKMNINLTEGANNVELEKKIKWDCDAHFNDQIEPSSSGEENPQSSSQAQTNASNSKISEVPKREKCWYGAQCYRKNTNHKNNYSHPGDFDYTEDDDKEECRYGIKCYRKNTNHKLQFKHTTRCRDRKATPVRLVDTTSETEASSAEESVDESDYQLSPYTESSDEDWEDSKSDWEDDMTG